MFVQVANEASAEKLSYRTTALAIGKGLRCEVNTRGIPLARDSTFAFGQLGTTPPLL
jgi:hypothetical protein